MTIQGGEYRDIATGSYLARTSTPLHSNIKSLERDRQLVTLQDNTQHNVRRTRFIFGKACPCLNYKKHTVIYRRLHHSDYRDDLR
jgi:hypothetical protein